MKTKIKFAFAAFVVLNCIALSPAAQAVVPSPDGGYPNGNTAEGQSALLSLTTGAFNTANGVFALRSDTTSSFNTAVGAGALVSNDANENTAVGAGALLSNTTGYDNPAVGAFALASNVGGINSGNTNTAVGARALQRNTTGHDNTAVGIDALSGNVDGIGNVAIGYALPNLNTGDGDIGIGGTAGLNLLTGSDNIYIGQGMQGSVNESDHTYIRNINTTSVVGMGTDFVTVDLATGLLGHLSSSQRYKEDIKPMAGASETLYRLKPVTFRYKQEVNSAQTLEYGLVAEDVADVDPNLAIRDGKGQVESVRYMAVYAMLLNEFLKEHRKVEKLTNDFQATVAQQQKEIQALTATVKEQASLIQKVNAQIEASKPGPQTVLNRQ